MYPTEADPSFLANASLAELALTGIGALVLISVSVLGSFKLKFGTLLGVSAAIGVLQFFGPLGFTSVSLVATAALLPGLLVRTWPHVRAHWPAALALLVVWQAVSTLWSAKVGASAYGVATSLALLSAYLCAVGALREAKRELLSALTIAMPLVWLEALLVIVFRLVPTIELAYLTSPIARLFTEPGVEAIAGGGQANVLDIDKAGGLILNGNIASLFLGMAACLFLGTGMVARRRVFYATAAIALIGALATGSKSAYVLVILVPGIALIALWSVRRLRAAVIAAGTTVVAIALIVLATSLFAPKLMQQAVRTLGERGTLWALVFEQFPSHWFLGFGFGNWREFMAARMATGDPSDATMRILPPHNLFLQAWVDAGLPALLLTLLLALLPVYAVVRTMHENRERGVLKRESLVEAAVLAAVTWPLLHGMTDTTIFSGDNHTIVLYGIAVALALTGSRVKPDSEADRGPGR